MNRKHGLAKRKKTRPSFQPDPLAIFIDGADVTQQYDAKRRRYSWYIPFALALAVVMAYIQDPRLFDGHSPIGWFGAAAMVVVFFFHPFITSDLSNRRVWVYRRKSEPVTKAFRLTGGVLTETDWALGRKPKILQQVSIDLNHAKSKVFVYHDKVNITSKKFSDIDGLKLPTNVFASADARKRFCEVVDRLPCEVAYFDDESQPAASVSEGPFASPHDITSEVSKTLLSLLWSPLMLGSVFFVGSFLLLSDFVQRHVLQTMLASIALGALIVLYLARKFLLALRRGRIYKGVVFNEYIGQITWQGNHVLWGKTVPVREINSAEVGPYSVKLTTSSRGSVTFGTQWFASDEKYQGFLDQLERSNVKMTYIDKHCKPVSERPARESI
ncbi:MAG TPA: hypothetical protein VNI20_01195 [Fimbriimonadaceae bacterium]|nr:hypothetical protein [Fimbriimonadaceae bacterium]